MTTTSPEGPEAALARAEDAILQGDFAQARGLLRGLLAGQLAEPQRKKAEGLLASLAPDRAAIVVALIGVVVLVAIVFQYLR